GNRLAEPLLVGRQDPHVTQAGQPVRVGVQRVEAVEVHGGELGDERSNRVPAVVRQLCLPLLGRCDGCLEGLARLWPGGGDVLLGALYFRRGQHVLYLGAVGGALGGQRDGLDKLGPRHARRRWLVHWDRAVDLLSTGDGRRLAPAFTVVVLVGQHDVE